MSTAKQLMHDNEGYFESLSKTTKEIVKDAILQAAQDRNGPEGWKQGEEALEDIECHSRDGFMPFSHNKGGIEYKNFTTLMEYWGGGYSVAHKKAAKEIERQIAYGFDAIQESIFNQFKDLLTSLHLTQKDCNYSTINELEEKHPELRIVRQNIEDAEIECLGTDYASIMHDLRFMYHGINNKGLHSASVSAAVNTEGPYHRSHIQWQPSIFCEGAKEVTITWKNNAELKRKLEKAFKQVSKAVF